MYSLTIQKTNKTQYIQPAAIDYMVVTELTVNSSEHWNLLRPQTVSAGHGSIGDIDTQKKWMCNGSFLGQIAQITLDPF